MTDRTEIFPENIDFLPPDDIVFSVNPFKRAMNRILTGFALCAVTFNFFNLNYILPVIGMLLILLGFRSLRGENKWFSACFAVTIIRLIYLCTTLLINTTIYHADIYASRLMIVAATVNALLLFVLFMLFGKALITVQQKADLPRGAGGISALIIWYAVLFGFALLKAEGLVIAIIMLVSFSFIIYSLFNVSRVLDNAGYAITPAPVKISDFLLCSIICALLIFGGICGNYFFGSYPMDWQLYDAAEHENTQELKSQLAAFGFPEEVLNDLSLTDLLNCKDALNVKVETQLHPLNDGRQVTEVKTDASGRKTYVHSTVYDQKELRITSVAVLLPTEKPSWKIFHHFTWEAEHKFYGTECIRIIPAYNFGTSQGWMPIGEISGHILYDEDNTSYIAPYKFLGRQTHHSNDMFFGQNTTADIYATFSMPKHGTKQRGYVCYTTIENQPGWMLSSWVEYTHRQNRFQYPNQSAMEETQKGILEKSNAYKIVSDAIQFYPYNTTPTE